MGGESEGPTKLAADPATLDVADLNDPWANSFASGGN